jgi:hypothetical protein
MMLEMKHKNFLVIYTPGSYRDEENFYDEFHLAKKPVRPNHPGGQ